MKRRTAPRKRAPRALSPIDCQLKYYCSRYWGGRGNAELFHPGLAAVMIKHALKVSPLSSLLGEASDKVCEATLADDTPPQEEEGGSI